MHRWTQLSLPFLYILFYAELHAQLIRLVFSLFLYILFYPVLHAPLDTLAFSVFFCKYVLCSVTCTVGHRGVFRVLFVNTV